MKKSLFLITAPILFLVGCGSSTKQTTVAPVAPQTHSVRAKAEVVNAKGKSLGNLELVRADGGIRVTGELVGLTPGRHGFHVHQNHECKGPDFKTAGDHFNPMNHQHGLENPAGAHAGDLPNIVADKQGHAEVDVMLKNVSLATDTSPNSLLAGMGTALVVHAKADDQKTNPSGASGDRVGCGLIVKE